MCGIAGLINLNGDPISPVLIQRMTDSIAHRGPDGEGQWVEGNVGIGHRRLAIIDLSPSGHQPMQSPDGRWILTYNGEIYNFRELRLELEAKGHRFRTNTDSEVVLHAIIEWGHDAIPRFNGMFAFALWDRHERKMLLARDRYGIKPLYYSFQGNRFAFASENKAIITHPQFRRVLNRVALIEYFTFQNIFTDQTLLSDIHMLPAGHWMLLDISDRSKRTLHQYWNFDFREPKKPLSHVEYVEELHRLFVQAVQRQLVSDVEVGTYLSGGIDSGSITAVASASLPQMRSFTCGFDLGSATGLEVNFDERPHAEALSVALGTELYEVVLKSGDMQRCLAQLVWHVEEPRVGQSYPNFYAAQLASKFVKVVMAGTGGDELFGGYPWRYITTLHQPERQDAIEGYYAKWQRLASHEELRSLFRPVWEDVKDVNPHEIFANVLLSGNGDLSTVEALVNGSLYFEAKTFLHGLLVIEDKISMAHGLETRVPFLDNDLVEFAQRCPVRLKVGNLSALDSIDENDVLAKKLAVLGNAPNGKLILRRMASRLLPSESINRGKQGFSGPDASWFKGESFGFVQSNLLDDNAPILGFLDRESISRILQEHSRGERNRRLMIWSLLSFNAALKNF